MEIILSLASILGALLIGAISPGPSFVFVARTSMAASRVDGLFAAIGMGIGGVVFSAVVLLGIQVALASVLWLYLTLKLVGGLYLIYVAICIWRGAKEPIVIPGTEKRIRRSVKKSFLLGLFTQLSNPKTAVVYGSIFAALLPHNLPPSATLALPFLVFLVETGWYSIVALALSSESSRAAYLQSKLHVDRVAGGVMGLLGFKLVAASRPVP
ncbi:MAG: LysE family translocator [Gammaproteobacteria bacterium]|nr:MAG: LysE family translocator [Gammaproteobacteria bacterium]